MAFLPHRSTECDLLVRVKDYFECADKILSSISRRRGYWLVLCVWILLYSGARTQYEHTLAIDVIYSIGFIVWDTIFISFVFFSPSSFAGCHSRSMELRGFFRLALPGIYSYAFIHILTFANCIQRSVPVFSTLISLYSIRIFWCYLDEKEPQVEKLSEKRVSACNFHLNTERERILKKIGCKSMVMLFFTVKPI